MAGTARILLVVACLGWGIGFPLMKAVMQAQERATGFPTPWLTAAHQLARYIGAGLVFAVLARLATRRWPDRSEWTLGAICGFSAGAGMQLQIDALNHAPASTVGFITQFYVLVIPLVAAFRQRRWPGWLTGISVILALAGVGILSGISPADLRPGLGEAMVLGASLIFTVQIMALEAPRWAGCHGLQVCTAMFAVATALSLPLVALSGPGLAGLPDCYAPPGTGVATLLIIVLCTCVPYAIMNGWQKEVSSTEAGIIYCSEAVFTAIASLVLPGILASALAIAYANEQPTVAMLLGGGLVLSGAVLVQVAPRLRRSPAAGEGG